MYYSDSTPHHSRLPRPQSVNLSGALKAGSPILSGTLTVINPPPRKFSINWSLVGQYGLELLKWGRLLLENQILRTYPLESRRA